MGKETHAAMSESIGEQLKGMWGKAKEACGDAADATARAAKRTKLEAEIKYCEREIRLLKEKFGTLAYGAIVQEDENTLKSILAEIKPQIDGLNEQIAEKRERHAQLQQQ